jgi:hypothetical protein
MIHLFAIVLGLSFGCALTGKLPWTIIPALFAGAVFGWLFARRPS